MSGVCLMADLEARISTLQGQLPEDLTRQELKVRLVALLAAEMGVQEYVAEEAVEAWAATHLRDGEERG
ncbi:hypothetical protein [Limibacillus sp. MBR-115]|uniref:hypothetical protein n=1 Tax=Limibacillus sp. MBR-115 TaxID=3156465 RepID=UPI003390F210